MKKLSISFLLLLSFIIWTVIICYVDVQTIGPKGSTVGLAALNSYFHDLTGVHMTIYTITDWLGLVPVFFVLGFEFLGLLQWIKRKSILKVDSDILVLGVFYLVVFGAYILFEILAINYRPVLINGYLEASYPSSTTLLVMCVMPTVIFQFQNRIRKERPRIFIQSLIIIFTFLMVAGRMISGVHWLSDIIGGALLSGGLVLMYQYTISLKRKRQYND